MMKQAISLAHRLFYLHNKHHKPGRLISQRIKCALLKIAVNVPCIAAGKSEVINIQLMIRVSPKPYVSPDSITEFVTFMFNARGQIQLETSNWPARSYWRQSSKQAQVYIVV